MRILYITTVSCTINAFLGPHIEMLVHEGHQVDLASNFTEWGVDNLFEKLGCRAFQVDFSRSPLSPDNIRAYGQLKKVVEEGNYDIVHCHTPNASVITRLVCRKYRKHGLKVFYTAHGFHFYKGAPKLNWLVFYPVEKFCSRFTDKLITINQEDYALARERFHAREVHYVPGVGIDLSRFENIQVDRAAKRREIGVPEDAFLMLSVGELNENKNHQVVVRALAELKSNMAYYAIAGTGDTEDELNKLAAQLGISDRVQLLGYRCDVMELYCCADLFCFPSFREGLSVSLMEAMACGLPCVVSSIRGNVDLIGDDPRFFFSPFSVDSCRTAIEGMLDKQDATLVGNNRARVARFSIENVLKNLKEVYGIG